MKLRALLWSGIASLAAGQAENYCNDGVYIITARATNAKPGFARLATIKDLVSYYIPNSDALALPYPASKNPEYYLGSVMEGVKMLTQIITQYVDACPGHGIVLMGNSQGAHVVADTLAGYEYDKYPQFGSSTGLEDKYLNAIAAAIILGDPSNTAGQPILVGNSTHSGFHPRKDPGSWERKGLLDRVRSWCDDGDLFCDSGPDVDGHIGYVDNYQSDIVQFVIDKSRVFMATHKPAYSDPNSIPVDESSKVVDAIPPAADAAAPPAVADPALPPPVMVHIPPPPAADEDKTDTMTVEEPTIPSLGPSALSNVVFMGGMFFLIFYSFRSYVKPTLRRQQAGYFN